MGHDHHSTRPHGRRPGGRGGAPGRLHRGRPRIARAERRPPDGHSPGRSDGAGLRPRRLGVGARPVPARPGAGALRGVRAVPAHGPGRCRRVLPSSSARLGHRRCPAAGRRTGAAGAGRRRVLHRRHQEPDRAHRQHDDGAGDDLRRPRPASRRPRPHHYARLLLDRGVPAVAREAHRRDGAPLQPVRRPRQRHRRLPGGAARPRRHRPHPRGGGDLGALQHRGPPADSRDRRRGRRPQPGPGARGPGPAVRGRSARVLRRGRRPARPGLRLPGHGHPQVALRPAGHRPGLGPGLGPAHRHHPVVLGPGRRVAPLRVATTTSSTGGLSTRPSRSTSGSGGRGSSSTPWRRPPA
jgi:hypothetical protein